MVILLGEGKLPSVGRRVSQNIEISTSLFYGTMSFINGRIFYEKIYRRRKIYERIKQAKKAEAIGDVPIGCVIVHDGKIIARGYNKRNKDKTVLAHAELLAMKKACKKLGDWRLEDCTMYITLEPCQMCAGAIVQARVTRVVIGSMNAKAGCGGSILNLLEMQEFNHQAEVERGVLQEECSEMLSAFFRKLREIQKEKKKKRKLIQEKNQTDN